MNKITGTVIFGGSFDPVTTAHEEIVKNLKERFSRVIVMPCRYTPCRSKTIGREEERLDMLHLSLDKYNVDISGYELRSEGKGYTDTTIKEFCNGEKIYFAIGSEMLSSVPSWHNIEYLASHTILYIVPRPSYPADKEKIKVLNELGFETVIADFNGSDGSSSEVKITIAAKCPLTYLSPEVAGYISENNLYTDYCYVSGLYEKYHMKEKRIRHSFSTALCGIKLAKKYGVDTGKAATALLLHDIGKYISAEEAAGMGIKVAAEVYNMPEPVRHAEIGAEILEQLEGITDREITDAVRWHTTGKPDMTELEKIVYLADYIEPLRDFPGVEELRKRAEISVDEGVYAGLKQSTEYVGEKTIYKVTLDAYNYYKKELNK